MADSRTETGKTQDEPGCLFFVFSLAVPRGMWDLSSPTRDRTHTPCLGSVESQPLDHQGSPLSVFYSARKEMIKKTQKNAHNGGHVKRAWESTERAPNGQIWDNWSNKINNASLDYNLKYKINTHESILT